MSLQPPDGLSGQLITFARLHSAAELMCALVAGAELDAAQRSVARAADIVAQMVEYIRGSRVDDYAPLFALNARLCAMDFPVSSVADGESCLKCLLWCTCAEKAFCIFCTMHLGNRRSCRCWLWSEMQASQGCLPRRAMSLPLSAV